MKSSRLLMLAAAAAALATALPASAQLGGILRSIPGNLGGVIAPSAPAAGGGDLIQLLSESIDNIDEPKEVEIGRQLAALLLGSKPLHPDMALQRYVNRLGRWISLQSPRPQLPWTFGVLDDPGFNAFAAPGGYIFVTKGLVDRVDEAELAGILAHEISHVTEKHHLKALSAKARTGLVAQAIGSQVRGGTAAQIASQQLVALFRNIYSSGLDQGDEFDADTRGVALAARAGFDPYGLPSVLQQLRTATPDNQLFTLTLSTHPPAQQRLERLEATMGTQLDAFSGKPSVSIPQRVRASR
jgi:predicted Zn-dependent protease